METWHAASDAGGPWTNDGNPLVYTNWAQGEPNNLTPNDGILHGSQDCAVINYDGLGLWDDQHCDNQLFNHPYVCQLGILKFLEFKLGFVSTFSQISIVKLREV